jgi:hypothetical protein
MTKSLTSRSISILLCVASIFCATNAQTQSSTLPDVKQWIGEKFPPYPDGYSESGGGFVFGKLGKRENSSKSGYPYAVSFIQSHSSKDKIAVIRTLHGDFPNKVPQKILDAIRLPNLGKKYQIGFSACMMLEEKEAHIKQGTSPSIRLVYQIAFHGNDKTGWSFDIRNAWRVDDTTPKFIKIDPKKIYCEMHDD